MTRLSTPPLVGVLMFGMALGQPVEPWPGPVSEVLTLDGARRGAVTPAPDGLWTARHCLGKPGAYVAAGEPVRAWGADPARDLAHIPGDPRDVALRVAADGDVLEVRVEDRSPLRVRVVRWATTDFDGHVYSIDEPGWQAIVACHESGRWAMVGDSGAGAWHESGELAAIVVGAQDSATPRWPFYGDPDCGIGQRLVLVGLP